MVTELSLSGVEVGMAGILTNNSKIEQVSLY